MVNLLIAHFSASKAQITHMKDERTINYRRIPIHSSGLQNSIIFPPRTFQETLWCIRYCWNIIILPTLLEENQLRILEKIRPCYQRRIDPRTRVKYLIASTCACVNFLCDSGIGHWDSAQSLLRGHNGVETTLC